MITIGTAGHIDHGKSSIVKRLTGTDPDRLPEEKARGMTIDLGFAFYQPPGGELIALVDVPGHERFVKNMIAGAGGIDAVLLVVAADDGWMPQSQEHFQVVRLLGVRDGLVVINKIDLVQRDWLDLLEQDLKQRLRGSYLEQAPILRVSAETGEGFDELRARLNDLPRRVRPRRDIGKARLYHDRSFVRPGIGGVVTGTLRGGCLRLGQTVAVWPSERTGKVRSLQSNGRDVDLAYPGQRTAVSITGVDKEHLVRGGVITDRLDLALFRERPILALSIELLPEAPLPLEDGRSLLVIVGTTEATGEIRVFGTKEIRPGSRGIIFFRPEAPAYTLVGDHFIARLPSPMVTMGGGRVLDHLPAFPRRRELDKYNYLGERMGLALADLVISELGKRPVTSAVTFLTEADFSVTEVAEAVEHLKTEARAGAFGDFIFLQREFDTAVAGLTAALEEVLSQRSHVKGLSAEEVYRLSPYDRQTTQAMLDYLLSVDRLVKAGDRYNLAGRGMSLKGPVREAYDRIMAELKRQPYMPPSLSSLAAGGKNYKEAIKYILESGEGYKCGTDFVFPAETWDEITAFIRSTLKAKGELLVGELRDRFDFSRKFVIPILEETDRIKLTRRDGDKRVKGDRFESENPAV